MATSAVASQPSWLTSYDPTDPSTLTGLLSGSPSDPINNSTPAGFDVLDPTALAPASSTSASSTTSSSSTGSTSADSAAAATAAAAQNQFQQALSSLTEQADTYLVQSALNGYQPLAAPAAFGSAQAYYDGLNTTAQTILSAGQSGNYGSLNALA